MVLAGVTQMPHMDNCKAPIHSSRELSLTSLTLLGEGAASVLRGSWELLYTTCPCLLPVTDCELPEVRGWVEAKRWML